MLAAQSNASSQSLEPRNNVPSTAIKLERRDSSTSESSLEHLDLGRTPKKRSSHTLAASSSTPHIVAGTNNTVNNTDHTDLSNNCDEPLLLRTAQQRLHDSDEANDYDDEDSADEQAKQNIAARAQRHHKRRNTAARLDSRTSVQLEYNADNPNSLRKKFRFNHSNVEQQSSQLSSLTSNESGFVDASGNSQYLNASAVGNSGTNSGGNSSSACSVSATASHSSSAASSPHGADAHSSVSSPEPHNGDRERECKDMKFMCTICDVVSATRHEFTNHIRCHNYASGDTENFTCAICSKVLSSASSLDRHVLVHTGERPFNCKYCHLTFTTNGNMHRHMRTHKQHQHNHHHRRNSNGNKNSGHGSTSTPAISNSGNNNINNSSNGSNAYAQLSNGIEGVKTPAAMNAALLVSDLSAALAAAAAGVNGKRLSGSGVESYESDGGCSTDSSSAISHSSNNHNNNNNNNNNDNSNNNNNTKANNNNNNNSGGSDNSSNFKRKNSDIVDDDDIVQQKRRMKITINNNVIGTDDLDARACDSGITDTAGIVVEPPAKSRDAYDEQALACPVCNDVDFSDMRTLSTHMDSEHPDILAKCRQCDVVFRSHHQLNLHPCTFAQEESNNHADSRDAESHLAESVERPKSAAETESYEQEEINQAPRNGDYFREFYLKSKALHSQALLSPPSAASAPSPRSLHLDESLDETAIKQEHDTDHLSHHLLSQQSHDSKDLADIQSILNMTSSSSTSNFLKNFEQSVNTPSSNYSFDRDEEEAQDAFTSEFRKMKLRGEFPCKLCTAVFPNLRALKGHNRVHLSAAGPAGPYRCNMCPYSVCDKAALVRHMRSHNGDRPYECAECNYAFTTKANCERHLRNRHAKMSREEVKRAIIYHPSEDSTCDDPSKKLHMFSSPDFDDDMELQYQHQPKDRSTPVSHLKEMLTGDSPSSKPMKIQVKSLEKLLDKSTGSTGNYNETFDEAQALTPRLADSRPIDLSMDVLDLSKKTTVAVTEKEDNPRSKTPPALPLNIDAADTRSTPLSAIPDFTKLPIPDNVPAYIRGLYHKLLFPFFMQNSVFPDLRKIAPELDFPFGGTDAMPNGGMLQTDINNGSLNTASNSAAPIMPQLNSLIPEKPVHALAFPAPGAMAQMLPKSLGPPNGPLTANSTLGMPRQQHMSPNMLPDGPVKMVIKNGVLMPKQKQRRYRTERPFACEHCSARFTLRSNMERHVKQQHPQFYAQRQRSGHHIMRGRGASSAANINSFSHLQAAFAQPNNPANNNRFGSAPISDQVKYAILAQQLNACKNSDLLQQALAHGSRSVSGKDFLMGAGPAPLLPNDLFNLSRLTQPNTNGVMEDDEPKLVIDEEEDDDVEEIPDDDNEEDTEEMQIETEKQNKPMEKLPAPVEGIKLKLPADVENNPKQVAETILEQAIKASSKKGTINNAISNNALTPSNLPKRDAPSTLPSPVAPAAPAAPAPTNKMKSMIAQAESVSKLLKDVATSNFKDESQDLVPVSKLVDNATNNSVSFNNYFRRSELANHMDQSDEEGLVASGSASESNNSGTEDVATTVEPKKKSAYSLAPNRVSCPYCQRMFPWSSSLRRHILTHTGQKPFKCSHCPLLFTTKSNCDRHLLRKHGNVESAVSVYVPTEDVTEPIPVPKSVEEIEQQQRQREEEERKRKAEEAQAERERREKELCLFQQEQEKQQLLAQRLQQLQATINNANAAKAASELSTASAAELPFKCHLCECSFGHRMLCVEHLKFNHAQEFEQLMSKGALDTDAESNQAYHIEEEERRASEEANGCVTRGGKYPDYSNRKVICAFCLRRFWSTEDLRRHMRTHSGERPFQCEICLRKFTLKHSMLRHMKKHTDRQNNGGNADDLSGAGNSGSDFSDDEQSPPMPMPTTMPGANPILNSQVAKVHELLAKTNEWRTSRLGEQKENIAEEHNNQQSDLIGNLLGISDQGILNKLLSSADEAAKLLGVEK